MIYKTPYAMFFMRADPLRGQVGGGLGPGNCNSYGAFEMALSRYASAIWHFGICGGWGGSAVGKHYHTVPNTRQYLQIHTKSAQEVIEWKKGGKDNGSTMFSMQIRIQIQNQLFISMQIQIQGAKPMLIHADLNPDPGQT
jgi:hypothetical protein